MILPLTPDAVTLEHATLQTFRFPSTDGKTQLAGYRFIPKQTVPCAIVQISHGMCEYLLRYADFADFLCAQGIEVWGHDHLGHGYSAPDADTLGFIAPKNGADFLIGDLRVLKNKIRETHPDVPIFLLGHSMGSFIARNAIAAYGEEYRGVLLLGTAGSGSPTGLGKLLADLIGVIRGKQHRSRLLKKAAFAGYNSRYEKGAPEMAWLSRDKELLDRYVADRFCNYTFTARAYRDLFDLLSRVSRRSWYRSVPADLPILLLSGEDDPVGAWGKGVREVCAKLQKAGVRDVTMHLYPGARHEIHTELNRDEVRADLLAWLEEQI